MAQRNTPIDIFLNWFENQNNDVVDTISFLVLGLAPEFNQYKDDLVGKPSDKLKTYLLKDEDYLKIAGKAIFIFGAIEMFIKEYKNVDSLINSQNLIKRSIETGNKGSEKFQNRIDFKNNWEQFISVKFNLDTINDYTDEEMLGTKI